MRAPVLILALLMASPASAGDRRGRKLVVGGETLQVSPELKRLVAVHTRRNDWDGSFKRDDGSDWKEKTRFRRLRGGASSGETLHVGRKPQNDHGSRWLVRHAEERKGRPETGGELAANDNVDGFKLSVERVGELLESHVQGATKLPNGRTLEVMAELIVAKRQVPFEVLTWKGRGRVRAPSGRFVVRDDRGLIVARGDIRALWRQARSTDGRWTARMLGLRVGELQELLVDLTMN